MNPVVKQPVVIDVYGGDVLEWETEVFDHKVFPSRLWSSSLSFVVTAGSDHVAGRPVWGASDHFPNEISLSCCDHVSDEGDGIEHRAFFHSLSCLRGLLTLRNEGSAGYSGGGRLQVYQVVFFARTMSLFPRGEGSLG